MREYFLTGCDDKTEWQLPWFMDNFRQHNQEARIVLADFGMSDFMRSSMESSFDEVVPIISNAKGWFKKPMAIETVARGVDKVCWIDTDCEIKGNIEHIFDLSEPNKLGMVEDRPWTRRRNELGKWYNSGVVLVEGCPSILNDWTSECESNPVQGDQEVLYLMMGGDEIKKLTYINPLPHAYNTLRIDYIDGIAVKNPKIIHHTGAKGNEVIRSML